MNKICAKSGRIATKLVRATMEEMRYFLLRNKEFIGSIKIIHLLRDPRGRVNSFLKRYTELQTDELNQWQSITSL